MLAVKGDHWFLSNASYFLSSYNLSLPESPAHSLFLHVCLPVTTLEQKLEQDQKVLKKLDLFQELPGPGESSKPLSAGQSISGSLLMPGDEASSKGHGHSTALKAIQLNTQ